MARRIRFTFTGEAVSAVALLREDDAPKTCAAVWEALPVAGESHHAIYSGSECVLLLPELLKVAAENASADPDVGDVGFAWIAPGQSWVVESEFSEICWFYGKDGKPRMPEGPFPVSLFARFEGETERFFAACRRMRREGAKPLRIERA